MNNTKKTFGIQQTLLSVLVLIITYIVYPKINEVVYMYASMVFNLSELRLNLFIAAMDTIILVPVGCALYYAVIKFTSSKKRDNRFIFLLAVITLTYSGKIKAALEFVLNLNIKSWEDRWNVHTALFYVSLIISVMLSVFALIGLYGIIENGFDQKRGMAIVVVYTALTIILNTLYVIKCIGSSVNLICCLSVITDFVKLLLISVVLLNKKVFNNERIIKIASLTVLYISFFINAYDLSFVPYDLLKRIDHSLFQG